MPKKKPLASGWPDGVVFPFQALKVTLPETDRVDSTVVQVLPFVEYSAVPASPVSSPAVTRSKPSPGPESPPVLIPREVIAPSVQTWQPAMPALPEEVETLAAEVNCPRPAPKVSLNTAVRAWADAANAGPPDNMPAARGRPTRQAVGARDMVRFMEP